MTFGIELQEANVVAPVFDARRAATLGLHRQRGNAESVAG
jgi:hypothetical protein